jgi:hypothetical protein
MNAPNVVRLSGRELLVVATYFQAPGAWGDSSRVVNPAVALAIGEVYDSLDIESVDVESLNSPGEDSAAPLVEYGLTESALSVLRVILARRMDDNRLGRLAYRALKRLSR